MFNLLLKKETLTKLQVHLKKQTSSLDKQDTFKPNAGSTIVVIPYETSQAVTEHSVQNIAPTTIKEVTKLIGETRDKKTAWN